MKILRVIDTRDVIEIDDRFVPVPGSGEAHACDRCGREHEVHAIVELTDGTQAVVGTGCMIEPGMKKEAASLARKATTRNKLEAELAAARTALAAHDALVAEVAALPAPTVERTTRPGERGPIDVFRCGDSEVWAHGGENRTDDAVEAWRSKQAPAHRGWALREKIARIEKRLQA